MQTSKKGKIMKMNTNTLIGAGMILGGLFLAYTGYKRVF
jgi:hypothetical protein